MVVRFIVNFILFGILFYLIYVFFPDAFLTLVSWAQKTYDFLKEVTLQIASKVNEWRGQSQPAKEPTHQAIQYFLSFVKSLLG